MTFFDDTLETLIVVGLVVPLFLLWIVAYVDVARRSDLAVGRKVMWGAVILFGAYVGIAVYFIMRPVRPPAGKDLAATTPHSSEKVARLEQLREQLVHLPRRAPPHHLPDLDGLANVLFVGVQFPGPGEMILDARMTVCGDGRTDRNQLFG